MSTDKNNPTELKEVVIKPMTLTKEGKELIMFYEGCHLEAYLCPAKIPSIGFGNTFYIDGSKVKLGDKITHKEAVELFDVIVEKFAKDVRSVLVRNITNAQFSAIVSFAFNVGMGNLKLSTLLKKVNKNPLDTTIPSEFLRWNKAKGIELSGLTKRRTSESILYSSGKFKIV